MLLRLSTQISQIQVLLDYIGTFLSRKKYVNDQMVTDTFPLQTEKFLMTWSISMHVSVVTENQGLFYAFPDTK